jgi:hypothetical protein
VALMIERLQDSATAVVQNCWRNVHHAAHRHELELDFAIGAAEL